MVFYGQNDFYGQDEYEKGPSLYCSGNGVVNPQYFKPKTTFTYTPGSGCSIPKLTVDNISHNGATLKVANGSGTYNVEYAQASSETWQSVAQNSKQATFNLTGLSSQTDYKVRVQSACGSEWREAYFTTAVEAPSVGDSWSDDFEGSTCGWNLVNGSLTNAWAWGTAAKHGGTKGLYISNDGGTSNAYTNSYTMVYATKLLYFAEGKYQFSYNWRANGENAFDYLRVALVPASKTLTASEDIPNGFTVSTLPEGWMALDGGRALNEKSEWQRKEAVANVSGTYYLVFAWRNDHHNQDDADKNPPAAIDNVSITKITSQLEAEGLTVDNSTITQTGATATWTGNAEQWQVSYATDANFLDATETIVSTKSYAMTNLQPGTLYYVRVRAYSSGYGTWCEALSFKTVPGPITSFPWTENFNGLTEDLSIPEFWDNSEGTTDVASRKWCYKEVSNGPTVNSGHNGTKCIRFDSYYNANGKTNFLKTPPLTFPADKDMRLKFWYKNPTGGDFSVYITTDDGTTALATGLTGKDEWTEMRIPLTDYVGAQNVVIVFKGTSNYADGDAYIYLDDVTVEYTPRLLTLEASPNTGGTVEVLNGVDDGVTDNGDGTYDVVPGTEVTLTYEPAEGYKLTGLTSTSSTDAVTNNGDGTATLTVTETATVTATFAGKPYQVLLDGGVDNDNWTGKAGDATINSAFPITAKTGETVTVTYGGNCNIISLMLREGQSDAVEVSEVSVTVTGAKKQWEFTMPGGNVVLSAIYAEATILDADGDVVQSYPTLKEAFMAVQNDETIKLDYDVTVTNDTDLMTGQRATEDPVQFTLDFNGYTIDGTACKTFMNTEHVGDEITFIDSNDDQNGGFKGMVSGKANSLVFASGRYNFGDGTTAADIKDMWKSVLVPFGWTMAPGKEFVDLEGGADANDGFTLGIDYKTYELAIGAGKFATFYDSNNVELDTATPTGVKLYTIKGDGINADHTKVTLTEISSIIGPGTPMLVYNGTTEKLTVKLKVTTGIGNSLMHDAAFQGTAEDKSFTDDDMEKFDYYALSGGKAFARILEPGTVGANKCWLQFTKAGGNTRSIMLVFGDATGITAVSGSPADNGDIYDLNGRKVANGQRSMFNVQRSTLKKGVYVKDGQKVIIK